MVIGSFGSSIAKASFSYFSNPLMILNTIGKLLLNRDFFQFWNLLLYVNEELRCGGVSITQ